MMNNKEDKMPNGLEILGSFERDGNRISFKGGETKDSQNNVTGIRAGVYILEDKISNGKISADISFDYEGDELNSGEAAEIIFAYKDYGNFMCAGLTGDMAKYECRQWKEDKWFTLYAIGSDIKLNKESYHLEVEIDSPFVRMKVNNVDVFQMQIVLPEERKRVGIWTSSKKSIVIENFKIERRPIRSFVISKFGGPYDDLYNEIIRSICMERKIEAVRADDISMSTFILEDIINLIKDSDFIIADISENNPNVFFELGYAKALKKNIILLCDKSKQVSLPFDISGYRTIFYENSFSGKTRLEEGLKRYIDEILNKIG